MMAKQLLLELLPISLCIVAMVLSGCTVGDQSPPDPEWEVSKSETTTISGGATSAPTITHTSTILSTRSSSKAFLATTLTTTASTTNNAAPELQTTTHAETFTPAADASTTTTTIIASPDIDALIEELRRIRAEGREPTVTSTAASTTRQDTTTSASATPTTTNANMSNSTPMESTTTSTRKTTIPTMTNSAPSMILTRTTFVTTAISDAQTVPLTAAAATTTALTGDRCRFSAERTNTDLMGCPSQGGCRLYRDLDTAMASCNANPTCGGVALQNSGYHFLRGGPKEVSYEGTSSWVCYDQTLHCTDPENSRRFPVFGGHDHERCQAGNDLNNGYEYVYNVGYGTEAAACGAGSMCHCCKRRREVHSGPSVPKILTILTMQLNFADMRPNYGSNKQVENAIYGREGGDAASGETEGSFAHIINSSSYGRIIAPRWAGATLTLDLSTKWGDVTGCPMESIARDARQKIFERTDVDLDAYDFHAFLLPNEYKADCPFTALAQNGCGNPNILPLTGEGKYCSSWFFSTHPNTLAHEFGHNLGLGHSVNVATIASPNIGYDPQAVVSNAYVMTDFIAAHRFQMGVLRETKGEVVRWTPETPIVTLQSISLPLGFPEAEYVAMRIPCEQCVAKQTGWQDNVGGDLFVQFRGDDGSSGLEVEPRFQNKVYVHLSRKLSRWSNQYGGKTGKGTELWAMLDLGETWSDTDLGVAVFVCEISAKAARISVAGDVATAQQRCPNLPSTTTYAISRCAFTPMHGKRISGYVWNWLYDSFEDAQMKCDQESTCTGIYQSSPTARFEVRTGGTWGYARSDAVSWACYGSKGNGEMITNLDSAAR